MRALDHKLMRDLWRIRGQAGAIALVVAVGVSLLIMMSGMLQSLRETRVQYYESYRLAEVFAPVTRAPARVIERVADLPGVAAAEGRIQGAALLDMPGQALPVRAIALSLPRSMEPRLNALYLKEGRFLSAGHMDEVVVLESFARAHDLALGDHLTATMQGSRRTFQIVGFAAAPEYLFTTAPGEFVPDDARFAALWMHEEALAAAFDLKGAVNEVLIELERGANAQDVLTRVDHLLDRYGGQGAYERKDSMSDRFISEEISGLVATSVVVPPIFLGVAAFLLYIVITRLVQAEREQIGLIKAFGYTDFEVALHYFKMVLVIAVVGAAMGCAIGLWGGRFMAGLYQSVYHFPFLVFRVEPSSLVTGVITSILAASAGGIFVLRGVFRLTPAVAMRPPAPMDFSRTGALNNRLRRWLDQPTRMVLRRILRNPGRIGGAVLGIAVGMGLSSAQMSVMSGFDDTLDLTFGVIDRSDVAVSFFEPMPAATAYAMAHLPGVIEVEPMRSVSAVLRNGRESYRGSVTGLVENARLNRAVRKDMSDITMPAQGIVLARALADTLNIGPGETLRVEVLDGRRPVIEVQVAEVAQTLLGAPAYMRFEGLNRALGEWGRVSAVYLRVDAAEMDALYAALKEMPTVAGVTQREDARAAMQKLMDTGAGAMRYVMAAIAGVITFGIVYNAARIAFGEQSRDLASLRVMGFTRGETSYVLLGELVVVVLLAVPLGIGIGYYLSFLIAAGFSTDLYQIPTGFRAEAFGFAGVAVLLATVISGALVRRDIDKVDLVETLKTRE
ncbi:MAG: ABC transporter permease [Rhodobacteraceae bacterium]|nr:ABC transporter permease [Paracoccaceae bacterium]